MICSECEYLLYLYIYILMHWCLCCVQVGVIGLVEAEWVSTLGTIDPHFVRVVDYVRAARFFAQRLRLEFVRSLLLLPLLLA